MLLRLASITLAAWTAHASGNVDKTALRSSTESGNRSRELSFDPIAKYIPKSLVTDHNAIDLDQKYLMEALDNEDSSGFNNALSIYKNGGNSKAIARVGLMTNLPKNIAEKSSMVGYNEENDEINFTLFKTADQGTLQLHLRYDTITVQEYYNQCRVGSLQPSDRITSGCLKSTGVLKDKNGAEYKYSYATNSDNYNARTLQYFSKEMEYKMLNCVNCPYKDANMFAKYYGEADYGDKWINAAFKGQKTLFDHGNADFSLWGYSGRAECIQKGTVYMNVFMFILREFENALDLCGDKMYDDAVHAWDKGVAYYTGSSETETGLKSGYLLHALADKRCRNFKTCGLNGDLTTSTSQVNHDILRLTNMGQAQLEYGSCKDARKTKEKIADIMYVPLIQGTLRYAYKMGKTSGVTEKEKGEGAVFAAAVLPRIHAANPESAKIIYDNMGVGASSTSFKVVKKAFEAEYKKMNIGCSQVGGLVTDSGSYVSGASPCTYDDDSDDKGGDDKGSDDDDKGKGGDDTDDNDDSNGGLVLGAVLGSVSGVLFLGAIGTIMFINSRKRVNDNPVFEANETNQTLD